MGCYIASNNNRHYAALEATYGTAAAATAENRIPALKLGLRQQTLVPRRRDKTGSRTFPGLPPGFRTRTDFELSTYLTHWPDPESEPCYSALFRGALGAAPVVFTGAVVQGVTDGTRITTAAAHGLVPNQAVRFGNEIRFVAAVSNTTAFVLNAGFAEDPAVGAALGAAITYMPAANLPGVTIYDYWDPGDAVQRIIAGAGIDKMRIQVNGDFHHFEFDGLAACLIESVAFTPPTAGLDEFPVEPAGAPSTFPLVPGSLGQAWFGVEPARFHTVVEAAVQLDNDLDLRASEFGIDKAKCIAAGIRTVTLDMRLIANTTGDTNGLYQAARQRTPVSAMFQLGQQAQHLCGVYMPTVVPEIPEFDDEETRLQWRFRNSRAQGAGNDELIVAFV